MRLFHLKIKTILVLILLLTTKEKMCRCPIASRFAVTGPLHMPQTPSALHFIVVETLKRANNDLVYGSEQSILPFTNLDFPLIKGVVKQCLWQHEFDSQLCIC